MASEVQLTDKQKRKAINKKPQKVLKNILADPFSKYWPEANVQERQKFLNSFSGLIPEDIPVEEKSAKKKLLLHLILGLSTLVQKINDGKLFAAAFSSNLEPKFITRQIMTLALSKNPETHLLVVPNLEEIMQSTFGIKSYTFGITKDGPSAEDLTPVCDVLKEISSRFPPPVKVKYAEKGQAAVNTHVDTKKMSKKPVPLVSSIDFDVLYLKRSTEPGKKAWTPSNVSQSTHSKDKSSMEKAKSKQWSDFISLNDDLNDDEETDSPAPTDLDEERIRLRELLLSTNPSTKEEPMECDNDEEPDSEDAEEKPTKGSIFLRPEETSGNQWASLLKPENITTNLNKQQKRKEKRQRRKEKKTGNQDGHPTFHPMKVHKIQPNPMKIKKKKKVTKAKK